MTVLNSILLWIVYGTKTTGFQLPTFLLAELDLSCDYGISTSDGRFSEPQTSQYTGI
jgi:hypothetical protein